jgi:hypothetical protein
MYSRHALALLSVIALSSSGCSKPDAAACASKLASLDPKANADSKKAFAAVCSAVSSKAQACITNAAAEKDVEGCVSQSPDKEAFALAIMGAALAAASAPAASSSPAIPTAAPPPPAAAGPTKLDKLGLQIDVPGETMVGDGIGPKSQMVNAVSVGGMTISAATPSTAKTLKAAKSEAQIFTPKNVQGEQTSDGYWLTFENKGSLGTNYWVKVLRHVGKQGYVCEGTPDTADKEAAVLAACRTLRPLT